MADQVGQQRFGGVQGKPPHGAGHIHDKDILPGRNSSRFHPFGRLHHQQKEIFLLSLIQEQPRFDVAARQSVLEDHIPISTGAFLVR